MMTLQERMLEYRAKNNLSQDKCAQKAGITLQTWMHVERGIQKPSRLTEQKIKTMLEEKEE